MITLEKYAGQEAEMCALIRGFWLAHNEYAQTPEETQEDLTLWTSGGHALYFIREDGAAAGFVHLASRGCEIDWLEDLFVVPERQGRGIGTEAVRLAEEIVRGYSESIYIEAAARNIAAIRLYRRLGYDCLNTITIRKDFPGYEYDVVSREHVCGNDFEIRRDRK